MFYYVGRALQHRRRGTVRGHKDLIHYPTLQHSSLKLFALGNGLTIGTYNKEMDPRQRTHF